MHWTANPVIFWNIEMKGRELNTRNILSIPAFKLLGFL